MSASHFDIIPRRGWVCPLCGKAHNPILMTCPCRGEKSAENAKIGIADGVITYPAKERSEQ